MGALGATLLLAASVQAAGDPPRYIVGGTTTTADAHPHQASLVYDASFPGSDFARSFCGGSLVTPRIVITAAHCLIDTDPDCGPRAIPPGPPVCTALVDPGGDGTSKMDGNDADVIVGRTTLSGVGGTEGDAAATYVAGNYTGELTKQNDLGFISLAAPSGQARIDIVDKSEGPAWKVGALTRVSGHGAIVEGGPQSDTLKVATVPVISDPSCASARRLRRLLRQGLHDLRRPPGRRHRCLPGRQRRPAPDRGRAARHPPRRHRQLRRGVRQGGQAGRLHARRAEPALHPGGPDRRPDRRRRGPRRRTSSRSSGPRGCSDTQFTDQAKKKKCKKKKRKKGKKAAASKCKKKKKKKKGKK